MMQADISGDLDQVGLGFSAPVADAQRVFRLVLDALVHPGRIVTVPPDILPSNDSCLSDAAAAVALTLLDLETAIWLDAGLGHAAAFLRFHTGSPVVQQPKASHFAFVGDWRSLPPLSIFALGEEDYPDRSTTLVLEVPRLEDHGPLTLRGPGIWDSAHIDTGLNAAFWRARGTLASMFPLGLDLLFTCGRRLAALPRTTRVEGF